MVRQSFSLGLLALVAGHNPALAQSEAFMALTELRLPVTAGAREPALYPLADGRILMSWTEPSGSGFTVKTAIGDSSGWTEPQPVVTSNRLFVNWADFPSVAAFPDGTLAAHWLIENGQSSYDYDVNIALSADQGRSWGKPIIPHDDRSQRQHGFVSMLPVAQDRMLAVWLDGRDFDIDGDEDEFTNSIQLRATTIGSDGSLSNDIGLDARTCSCCQTSAAVTGTGIALVAYRDRTANEIRDISVIRLVDGNWSEPVSVHADGWEIAGCPVNGPAIDTEGENVVVVWFTAANDEPAVKVAFSDNAGESFAPAIQIDRGGAAGRVDALYLGDGSALVTWVEWTKAGEVLYACRTRPETGCTNPEVITLNRQPGTINFPRMALGRDGVYIAWTQPLGDQSQGPEQNTTIRMVLATP